MIHRLPCEGFSPSVDWMVDHFSVDRRIATFLLWEVATKIGTDRNYWIDESRANRYIENQRTPALQE